MMAQQPSELVVLAMEMPDIPGTEILPSLVGPDQNCQVIVTSQDKSLENALQVLRIGAEDFLTKPFSDQALLESIERAQNKLKSSHEMLRMSRLLQHRVRDLSVLSQISKLIVSSKPMEIWIDEVIQASCDHIGAEAGSLLLLDQESDCLVFHVSIGPKKNQVKEIRLARGHGIAWWCLQHGQPIQVDDPRQDVRFDSKEDDISGFFTRNIIAAPIVVRDERIGVIELLNKKDKETFSSGDLHRLTELSNHLAVATQNSIALRDLKRSREELARWSRELEDTVEQRTKALQAAHTSSRMVQEDLKRTHQVIQRTQQALIEKEKMATLGLLAAGVAHEINNPLGFVTANLTVLEDYARSLRQLASVMIHAQSRLKTQSTNIMVKLVREANRVVQDEDLEEIIDDMGPLFDEMRHGLTRITSIVEKLQIFAETDRVNGATEVVDVNDEAQRLVELVQGSGKRALQIRYELSDAAKVRIPVMDIRQMLLNLFGYFTRQQSSASRLILRTRNQKEHIKLELIDSEQSLTGRQVLGLFEPFSLTDEERQAGSLSLSVAKNLAQGVGGQMWATRLEPAGYCIHLVLPVVATSTPTGQP
jgi:signal transduction histidine kinase